ncbi:MAG: glutamine--fructose-6-phosphate transaminase (isomerizing) [Spirochaetia bacterium]|nr:glutamine--fructose-6-phosphate transaminase (isomerizing) [Spirochaetia bacterium]
MCGIVGYIGPKSLDSFLIVGLKKLEYRGYDSAGIAIIDKNELVVRKSTGKIVDLEKLIENDKFDGHVGIGHTRWATHGAPTKINAHPHTNQAQTIAVVHNGIIENYTNLKKDLINEGYIFISDTDTEIIAHLIEKYLKTEKNFENAFYQTILLLEGKFAIAAVSEFEPEKIFFVKDGAPLIIARNTTVKESFLASDLPALVPIAKESCYLENKQWGYMNNTDFKLYNWNHEPVKLQFILIDLKIEQFEKGKYEHFMLKEIHEQPSMIRRILANRIKDGIISFNEFKVGDEKLKKIGRILIQASGTSLIAGKLGKMYLENNSRIYTEADFSSEFRYRNPLVEGDTMVVGISQSGETADTIAGIHEAKSKFLRVISFVNNVNSSMARESDGIIDLLAGPEIGVASTKAYTAQLVNLFLFSLYLGRLNGNLSETELERNLKELMTIPEKIEKILNNIDPIIKIAEFLKDQKDTIFLGRTFNYPTSLEGSLKLKEISYIHASAYAAGEFKHGPIALVSENLPVILTVPNSEIRPKILSNLMEVKARLGKIITIVTEGDQEIIDLSDYHITIPDIEESLSPLLAIIPLQLLAYYTALFKGCNVDKPRNLAKSVTVE